MINIVIFYDYIVSNEETKLLKQFRDEYIRYQKEVSKWILGLKSLQSKTEIKNHTMYIIQ
ncbi:MAG: hypothetical protein KAS95_08615 [Candidatus Heimdallarchaeota archaeon]|nr:hypothetical protein [Candidatus Heimdallarchaeota archaeon]